MNLLCKLGIHKWGPWLGSRCFVKADVFSGQILMPHDITRHCEWCGKTKTRVLERREAPING